MKNKTIENIKIYERITYLTKTCNSLNGDKLKEFTAAPFFDELSTLRLKYINILFNLARQHNIRFLYVGKGEISGCEDIDDRDGWPAIWDIVKRAGYPGSCGNSNQYQTSDFTGILYPEDYYGGWDLTNNIKLSDEETEKKNFCRVVTREYV